MSEGAPMSILVDGDRDRTLVKVRISARVLASDAI
jgi:hypothetical protein